MGDEEREPRIFTLNEAERTRAEVEPVLISAIESRKRLAELDDKLSRLATRIQISGGLLLSFDRAASLRAERDRQEMELKAAIERIQDTGCVVKDLDVGLLDFPARVGGEDVYLCWRLGEDRIRFYHRQDEGFDGRKPLDPHDTGSQDPIQ